MSSSTTNPGEKLSAKPTRNIFDSWNSASTGHQHADNRLSGSTSWRQSRSLKLGEQFSSGSGGGKRVYDTVGAGSENFGKDGRKENGGWERGARGLRGDGQMSLLEAFAVKKGGVGHAHEKKLSKEGEVQQVDLDAEEGKLAAKEQESKEPQIFAGLTIYINGSTAPLVSDHQLKRLLVSHGANISIALGRRTVTHVVLGRPNSSTSHGGAGGGLAASKIQKEIKSKVGHGVKFVTVEWVLESVKQGKRAAEGRFEALRLAPKGTGDLKGIFAKAKAKG